MIIQNINAKTIETELQYLKPGTCFYFVDWGKDSLFMTTSEKNYLVNLSNGQFVNITSRCLFYHTIRYYEKPILSLE